MGWKERQTVRKSVQALPHGTIKIPRQGLGLRRTDEVGPSCPAGQQRSATEEGNRPGVVDEEVGQMLRCVPRRRQRLKGKTAKVDLRAVGEALIRHREL